MEKTTSKTALNKIVELIKEQEELLWKMYKSTDNVNYAFRWESLFFMRIKAEEIIKEEEEEKRREK